MRPTLTSLIQAADDDGVTVQWAALPGDLRGVYHHGSRLILLSERLSETLAVPTLMHELAHARRGDDGHQCPRVEAQIDLRVAQALIDPCEYATAERVAGGGSSRIAAEMGLPRWVVRAYRGGLRGR